MFSPLMSVLSRTGWPGAATLSERVMGETSMRPAPGALTVSPGSGTATAAADGSKARPV